MECECGAELVIKERRGGIRFGKRAKVLRQTRRGLVVGLCLQCGKQFAYAPESPEPAVSAGKSPSG